MAYLQVVISELRGFTIRTAGGGLKPGAEIIDSVWADMVDWHGHREREASRARSRADLETHVAETVGSAALSLLAAFDRADEVVAGAD